MDATTPRPKRPNQFDLLRVIFAIFVIYSHSFPLLLGDATGYRTEPLYRITLGQYSFGTLAVDGFFAISGFLITQSWLRRSQLSVFLKKRAARIYPGFLAVSAACALVFSPLGAEHPLFHLRHTRWRGAIMQALALKMPVGMADVLSHAPHPYIINGSLWTIRYEAVLYLLVAFLGLLGLLRRGVAACLLAIAMAIYSLPHLSPVWASRLPWYRLNWLFDSPAAAPRFFVFFLIGMVFALCGKAILQPARATWVALAIIVLSVPLRAFWLVYPVAGSYLVLYVATRRSYLSDRLSAYGDFSYGLYLWAFPIQQLLVKYAPGLWTPSLLFVASLVVTAPLAILSWYGIERPFVRGRAVSDRLEELANPIAFSSAGDPGLTALKGTALGGVGSGQCGVG